MVSPLVRLFALSQQHSNRGDTKLQPANEDMAAFFNDYELDHLVTEGIYSKLRNPMYFGIILMHIGFPLASRSLLTLLSAAMWTILIFLWKYMEGKDLEKKFGAEYLEYKRRTFF